MSNDVVLIGPIGAGKLTQGTFGRTIGPAAVLDG